MAFSSLLLVLITYFGIAKRIKVQQELRKRELDEGRPLIFRSGLNATRDSKLGERKNSNKYYIIRFLVSNYGKRYAIISSLSYYIYDLNKEEFIGITDPRFNTDYEHPPNHKQTYEVLANVDSVEEGCSYFIRVITHYKDSLNDKLLKSGEINIIWIFSKQDSPGDDTFFVPEETQNALVDEYISKNPVKELIE